MSNVINATDANFEAEVLQSEVPVLVDFWANWCGPCRALSPVLDDLAVDFADTAKIVKIDVDACSQTAAMFAVRSIPALMVFKAGEKVDFVMGMHNKEQLATLLNKHM